MSFLRGNRRKKGCKRGHRGLDNRRNMKRSDKEEKESQATKSTRRERERDRAEEEWGGVPFAQPACVSNVEKQFVPLSTNGVNFDRNAKVADKNVKIALY